MALVAERQLGRKLLVLRNPKLLAGLLLRLDLEKSILAMRARHAHMVAAALAGVEGDCIGAPLHSAGRPSGVSNAAHSSSVQDANSPLPRGSLTRAADFDSIHSSSTAKLRTIFSMRTTLFAAPGVLVQLIAHLANVPAAQRYDGLLTVPPLEPFEHAAVGFLRRRFLLAKTPDAR